MCESTEIIVPILVDLNKIHLKSIVYSAFELTVVRIGKLSDLQCEAVGSHGVEPRCAADLASDLATRGIGGQTIQGQSGRSGREYL